MARKLQCVRLLRRCRQRLPAHLHLLLLLLLPPQLLLLLLLDQELVGGRGHVLLLNVHALGSLLKGSMLLLLHHHALLAVRRC